MKYVGFIMAITMGLASCQSPSTSKKFTGKEGEVKLITLAPGHFHASLVQKSMLPQIDEQTYVYAPAGTETDAFLNMIESYNQRLENPTHWKEVVYTGNDFLEKMITENKGNVVILAGNNQKKTDYILSSIHAGFNVLSDKPMAIDKNKFGLLETAFNEAKEKGVLLYDIMTERYEVTNAIQRDILQSKEVFGELTLGTSENPAVELESVHHFLKQVSGQYLIRPSWYYDVEQQGDGIVDVTTHLIDLVNWKCFQEVALDYKKDVVINDATRWPTKLTLEDFSHSTNLKNWPDFLQKYIQNDSLNVYSNGYIQYAVKGLQVKISVVWNVEAPTGGGDTHKAVLKGTKSDILVLQGAEQQYVPELYLRKTDESISDEDFLSAVNKLIENLQSTYPGVSSEDAEHGIHIVIPNTLRKGHEAHFSQVTERFLKYLVDGKLPDWEIPNMLTKYFITTEALDIAKKKGN